MCQLKVFIVALLALALLLSGMLISFFSVLVLLRM